MNKKDMISNEKSIDDLKQKLKNILGFDYQESQQKELLNSEESNYESFVENQATDKTKRKRSFLNSSPTHAAIVLAKMLKYSESQFLIYDDNLSGDVADKYEGFYTELIKHVEKGKTLKVVVEDSNSNTKIYKILKLLAIAYPKTVYIKKSDASFKKSLLNSYGKQLNFAVGDEESFRFEEVTFAPNQHTGTLERKAFCSFEMPQYAKTLKNTFDENFETLNSVF